MTDTKKTIKPVLKKATNHVLKSSKNMTATDMKQKIAKSQKIRKQLEKCRAKQCPKVERLQKSISQCIKKNSDEYKKDLDKIIIDTIASHGVNKLEITKANKIKNPMKRRMALMTMLEKNKLDMKKINKEASEKLQKNSKYKNVKSIFDIMNNCYKSENVNDQDLMAVTTHCQETRCSDLDNELINVNIFGSDFVKKTRKKQRNHFKKIKSRKNIENLLD